MKSVIVFGPAVVGAGIALIGAAGVAWATPNVVNMTYADAVSELSDAGLTSKISVVVGDMLPTSECIVTAARTESALRPEAANRDTLAIYDVWVDQYVVGSEILLTLNCNGGHATVSSPGNSVQSPAGRAALAAEEAAASAEESVLEQASVPDE